MVHALIFSETEIDSTTTSEKLAKQTEMLAFPSLG